MSCPGRRGGAEDEGQQVTQSDDPRPPFPSRRQLHGQDHEATDTGVVPGAQRVHHSHGTHEKLPDPLQPLFGEAGDPMTTGMRSRRLEHERLKARRRRRNRRIRTFLVVLVVLALIGGAVYWALGSLRGLGGTTAQSDDFSGPGSGSVQVVVEQGDSGATIGQTLVDAGVVRSTTAFNRALDANKASGSIRPGTYTLKTGMTASDAVAALLDDTNRSDNTVTVIPGQTAEQVVDRIVSVAGFSTEDVEAALADTSAIGLPSEAGGIVEGWLAPGSYEVSSTDTPTSLLSEMVAATVKELDDLGVADGDRETLLVKASILEREVNVDEYLPQVARVIDNRLADTDGETKGRLQMDSTVLYGVGKTGGIPTAEDLADDNPYNTYLHAGLPPGPISQPSLAALKAVISPADGTWLYFVTVNLDTGETLFATTHDEQVENTKKLTQYCDDNPGKC